MKKVLVLLSTYNGEKYLPEQIESLLGQQGVDLHVLVRDDGSSDGTLRYLDSVSGDKIEYHTGENKRAVGSFLELLRMAPDTYDYYAYCDQDDVWKPEKLKVATERLDACDVNVPTLYYGGQITTDENLKPVYEHRLVTNRSKKACFVFNQTAGCTAVFNRTLLMKLKEYIPTGIYGHDNWTYKLCAALGGNIIVDSQGYLFYRQHGNNVVGLEKGLKGTLARAHRYIFVYNASTYAAELLKGYGAQLSPEWRQFCEDIVNAKTSFQAKIRLIRDSKIDFRSGALRSMFLVKTLLGKL